MTAVKPRFLHVVLPDGRSWPCAVRVSAKATRCRLRVDARGAATLVVPRTPPRSDAALQTVLDGLGAWLGKTVTRMVGDAAQPPEIGAESTPPEVPASISVPLSGMVWHVYVVDKPGRASLRAEVLGHMPEIPHVPLGQPSKISCDSAEQGSGAPLAFAVAPTPAGGRILLQGNVGDSAFAAECCRLLQQWLRREANRWLPPRLRLLAARMGVEVGRVTIRSQRGRWGSCSSRGDISLNCVLLLLPVFLLEHVCLHELCHMRHMDHSRRYRAHLSRHAPHWQWNEKSLNEAWRRMPAWALWRGGVV